MRAFSSKDKGHSSRHSSFWLVSAFSGETFMAVGKVSPYTKQQSRRETHSLMFKSCSLKDEQIRIGHPLLWETGGWGWGWGVRLLEGESKAGKRAAMTPGWHLEELSSQTARVSTRWFSVVILSGQMNFKMGNQFSSVQFSHSVMSDSLRSHESQHARPPCPSPTPGLHSNSRLLSRWCHPAISSSVVLFSSCPQSVPASESFPMSQLVTWGGQSTGVSVLASFLPKKSQGWSPSEWTGWISLQSKGLSRVFSSTTVQKHQFFGAQLSSQSNSRIHTWPLEKP